MTFIIKNKINGKTAKDAVTGKRFEFATAEQAEKFAHSMFRNAFASNKKDAFEVVKN